MRFETRKEKNELRNNAERLESLLKNILADLDANKTGDWSKVAQKYLPRLRPLAEKFSASIHRDCSRQLAAEIISEITPIVREISNLESRAEFCLNRSGIDSIEKFHNLSTTFRELKYQDQSL